MPFHGLSTIFGENVLSQARKGVEDENENSVHENGACGTSGSWVGSE
jgi:hypothetical protein